MKCNAVVHNPGITLQFLAEKEVSIIAPSGKIASHRAGHDDDLIYVTLLLRWAMREPRAIRRCRGRGRSVTRSVGRTGETSMFIFMLPSVV